MLKVKFCGLENGHVATVHAILQIKLNCKGRKYCCQLRKVAESLNVTGRLFHQSNNPFIAVVYVCFKKITDTMLAFNLVQTVLDKLQPTDRLWH